MSRARKRHERRLLLQSVSLPSLLSTCRNHDVTPRLYLNSVIAAMPYFNKASGEDIAQLLPQRWKLYHPEVIMATPVREPAK